jgi:site-specific recombinase XerD
MKNNIGRQKIVSDNDIKLVMSKLNKRRDIVLYKLLAYTGVRIQEALDLEIDSVPVPDMSQLVGCVRQIKSKGKTRDLYVPMNLMKELYDFIQEERNRIDTDHRYVFISEKQGEFGKQLTYREAYNNLKRVQAVVGVNFNFSDMRRSYCLHLVERGMEPSVIRILMGNMTISPAIEFYYHSNMNAKGVLSKF